MTPKYYEVVSISEKPEKDGAIILLDKLNIPESGEFKNGKFFSFNPIAFNMIPVKDDSEYRWLRPIENISIDKEAAAKIVSEAWDEGSCSSFDCKNDNGEFDMGRHRIKKSEYLKKFEK